MSQNDASARWTSNWQRFPTPLNPTNSALLQIQSSPEPIARLGTNSGRAMYEVRCALRWQQVRVAAEATFSEPCRKNERRLLTRVRYTRDRPHERSTQSPSLRHK